MEEYFDTLFVEDDENLDFFGSLLKGSAEDFGKEIARLDNDQKKKYCDEIFVEIFKVQNVADVSSEDNE